MDAPADAASGGDKIAADPVLLRMCQSLLATNPKGTSSAEEDFFSGRQMPRKFVEVTAVVGLILL